MHVVVVVTLPNSCIIPSVFFHIPDFFFTTAILGYSPAATTSKVTCCFTLSFQSLGHFTDELVPAVTIKQKDDTTLFQPVKRPSYTYAAAYTLWKHMSVCSKEWYHWWFYKPACHGLSTLQSRDDRYEPSVTSSQYQMVTLQLLRSLIYSLNNRHHISHSFQKNWVEFHH